MRNNSGKIALLIVLLCNIITLSLCSKPVDVDVFLEDERVIEIIKNGYIGYAVIEAEFGIEDWAPELLNGDTLLEEGGTVTLTLIGGSPTAVITVSNADIYESIEWYCDSTTPLTAGLNGDKSVFTMNVDISPFNTRKLYYWVTVVGLTEDKRYGTMFKVVVE